MIEERVKKFLSLWKTITSSFHDGFIPHSGDK